MKAAVISTPRVLNRFIRDAFLVALSWNRRLLLQNFMIKPVPRMLICAGFCVFCALVAHKQPNFNRLSPLADDLILDGAALHQFHIISFALIFLKQVVAFCRHREDLNAPLVLLCLEPELFALLYWIAALSAGLVLFCACCGCGEKSCHRNCNRDT